MAEELFRAKLTNERGLRRGRPGAVGPLPTAPALILSQLPGQPRPFIPTRIVAARGTGVCCCAVACLLSPRPRAKADARRMVLSMTLPFHASPPDDLADFPDLEPSELARLLKIYYPDPPKLPAMPVHVRPGSSAKVLRMVQRFARGELIFHPQDLTLADLGDDLQRDATMLRNSRLDRDADPVEVRKSA